MNDPNDPPVPVENPRQPPVETVPAVGSAARPRLWPTLVLAVVLIPLVVLVGGVAVGIGLVADDALKIAGDPDALMAWLGEYVTTPLGFVLVLIVPEATFLILAFVPAMLSRVRFAERLGFVRGRLPLWGYPVLIAATPLTSSLAWLILMPFTDGLSDQLQMLNDMFVNAEGPMVVLLVVFLSVAPGLAEESLFRGYMLRRLLQRWHPAIAIGSTGILFGVVHFDPMHAVAVIPLGLWLGVLTWRTGSIWPAVVCHTTNNLMGILGARFGDPDATMELRLSTFDAVMLAIVAIAFVGAVVILVRCGKPQTDN